MNMGTVEDWERWFPPILWFLTFAPPRMILAPWSKTCAGPKGMTDCSIAFICQHFRELHNVKTSLDPISSMTPLLSVVCLNHLAHLSWKACSSSSSCPSHMNLGITGKKVRNHAQNYQTDRKIRFFFSVPEPSSLQGHYSQQGHHSYSISSNIHNWIWTRQFNNLLFSFVPAKDYLY